MFRSTIYDFMFAHLTTRWYREVLKRIPSNARLLDVGVGTAGALVKNADVIRGKHLHVTGIDIDGDYIEKARQRIARRKLQDHVAIELESIYDHAGGPYDAAYFSASFMLLEKPEEALLHVGSLLNPGGRILFTQTFSERRSRLIEIAKPLLGKFTTVEFGRVTYEDEFVRTLQRSGLRLEELVVMSRNAGQSFRLAIAIPDATG